MWEGPDAKKGPLKLLTLVRAPCKNYKFSSKNGVYMLYFGMTHNFHAKKGGLEIFWGGGKNFSW